MAHRIGLMPPRPPGSSADLAARTRAGSADALAELYTAYAGGLLALARRLTGSRAEAEDVVHDVFLGLPDALRRYDERGSLDAWLRRVTARVALTRLRSARRRRETGVEDADQAARPALADGSADAAADASDLARAIDALPDGLRTVFVLRAVEGYSHAEIARLLDISASASEVRFHRAVRRMRALLGGAP